MWSNFLYGLYAMKIFWILLALVFLLIIGSAGMLRYFDSKYIEKIKQKNKHPEE